MPLFWTAKKLDLATKQIGEAVKRNDVAPYLTVSSRMGVTEDALRTALRRHGRKPPRVPPTKKEPTPQSAQDLERAHKAAQEKAIAEKERKALIEENARLRRELDFASQIEAPSNITIFSKAPEGIGDAVACALLSDWHVEEPVEAHTVHGLNEYNLEIAEGRAQKFFQNFLKLAMMHARESNITRLYLGILGDLVTNYIHEELRETNLLPPGDAANFALKLLIQGIDFVLTNSDFTIDADAIPGNHGRMTLKPRIQNATGTSLETFLYNALALYYRDNPRVNIRVAKSKMVYRKYFETFLMRLIHGDDVKFGGGVGGITIPIRKKLAAWDKAQPADLTCMGHFHQMLDGGDFLVNGSLIGYNEFAQAIGASPEEAKQAFFLIHARKGGEKSGVYPIWLE